MSRYLTSFARLAFDPRENGKAIAFRSDLADGVSPQQLHEKVISDLEDRYENHFVRDEGWQINEVEIK